MIFKDNAPQNEICHHFLTLMSFQTVWLIFFCIEHKRSLAESTNCSFQNAETEWWPISFYGISSLTFCLMGPLERKSIVSYERIFIFERTVPLMVRCRLKRQSPCHFQCTQLLFSLSLSLSFHCLWSQLCLWLLHRYLSCGSFFVNHYHSSVSNDRIHGSQRTKAENNHVLLSLTPHMDFTVTKNVFTLMLFQICRTLLLLWNTNFLQNVSSILNDVHGCQYFQSVPSHYTVCKLSYWIYSEDLE